MMTCPDATSRLWEYLDEALEEADRELLETHLALCRQCCGELEFAQVLHGYLASQPAADELPEDVRGRIETFIQELSK